MKDRNIQFGFSWTVAFIASGICYLGLSGLLELINSNTPSIVFMWIGMVSMTLGCLSAIGSVLAEKVVRRHDHMLE